MGTRIRTSVKDNRTTTYKSLLAAVYLLFAEDRDTFVKYYRIAMHDNAGLSCWKLMEKD